MNGQLERRVVALESRADPVGQRFLVLFGDEQAGDDCDERTVVRIPWLTVKEARARGWR